MGTNIKINHLTTLRIFWAGGVKSVTSPKPVSFLHRSDFLNKMIAY